jgi:hypothetical protein
MKRLKRREVEKSTTVYEIRGGGSKIFTLDNVEGSNGFILISPLRDGQILTYLEKCGEVSSDLLIYTDDNDLGKYTLCGSQWWLVCSVNDERHKFRKEITFLMEQSFEKYSESAGVIDDESIVITDYRLKDKKVHKDYIEDDIIAFSETPPKN